jgi:hypothetical protein
MIYDKAPTKNDRNPQGTNRLLLDIPSFEAIFKLQLHREVCYVLHSRASGKGQARGYPGFRKKIGKNIDSIFVQEEQNLHLSLLALM